MFRRLMIKVTLLSIITIFLAIMAVSGQPFTGVQGSKIHANFMSQDPDPADAGKDIDLRWQIINTIPGIKDALKFHLDAGYPFLFEAGDSPDKDLGASAGTNDKDIFYVLHYKLRVADNAVKGTYNVTLGWTTGEGWDRKEYQVYIDPKRSDFVVGALITSPERLIADTKEARLSVNIENIGKGNAENVKVKLFMPQGFNSTYSYSDEDSLGIIEKESAAKANFFVDIDETIKEGEYRARIEISYKDENDVNNTYRLKTLDLLIPIKPAPYLIVESVMTEPDNLNPGNKANIRIKVKNSGNEKAESVSLRVFKDASQPFEFSEKSDFIGKLQPGESGDAVLKINVDKNAVSKKYLMDVELRGIDDKNNVVIFRRTVPLTVISEKKSSPSAGFLSNLVVFLAAMAAVSYLRIRKKE